MKLYETIKAANWLKGDYEDGRSRGCLAHWFEKRYGDHKSRRPLVTAITALYPERVRDPRSGTQYEDGSVVERFNDHPDTHVTDVIRVCKFADV